MNVDVDHLGKVDVYHVKKDVCLETMIARHEKRNVYHGMSNVDVEMGQV